MKRRLGRVILFGVVICSLVFLQVGQDTRAAALDPHLLALDVMAYPAGAVILHRHVDTTAAEVNAEGITGSPDTQGTNYAHLHFQGSLIEKVRLPFFNNAARALWLIATVFPNTPAAQQAFVDDTRFDQCDISPVLGLPIRTTTCAYASTSTKESGMYVVAATNVVEFTIIAFVEDGSVEARTRTVRDASYLARQEVMHVLHVLAGSGTPSSAATPIVSTQTPVPAVATVTPGRLKPVSSNRRCPNVLHNRDWAKVSLRPDLYAKCVVDIAGQVYGTQTLDNYVSYNTQLNPDNGPDWTVFAYDYSDNPPSIADYSWERIKGIIEASVGAYNTLSGAFQGNVPEIKVADITAISEAQAKKLGADAHG